MIELSLSSLLVLAWMGWSLPHWVRWAWHLPSFKVSLSLSQSQSHCQAQYSDNRETFATFPSVSF